MGSGWSASRLSRKCGAGAIGVFVGLAREQPIFRSNPFHADKISLKRGLKNRPGPGQEWFD
ncbi:hypothetical protein C7I87_10500 [Mesorhizobium sp. SARCC-RB16n]|nr:hypothetical protein C7I87_10500 [Mesorhizobium sp. SARCC-RB16n]